MSDHHVLETLQSESSNERPEATNPLKIMDLTLRDGHQSLFATRGRTQDMIPVAEKMDQVGFWAVEMWGGATFDVMHRYLVEDPWDRIRTLKRYFKKTPFSMLLRGQNLVGYRQYPDDVTRVFVNRAAENGIDIFRTFDALNDFRNFEVVVDEIKRCGKHFQGCVCYSLTGPRMGGEVYNIQYYVQKAKELEQMGADTICIKDMAGLLAPYDAFELISALKKEVGKPIHLHSHFTSGLAPMTHLKAIEAGVDIIDTCLSPYAYRTSHPAVEPIVVSLLQTNRDTGFDVSLLAEIDEILEKDVLPKYKHLLDDSRVSVIDIKVLLHQTPGGMISNLVNQLREMDALDKIGNVFEMLPKVRKDLGQVPLVTPTSQIVGIQTVNNVLFDTYPGEYKMITSQVKDLCYGLYGKTPAPINPEVRKKALAGYPRGDKPIDCRPGSILEPELDKAKEAVSDLTSDIDDILIYALYPVTGRKFLEYKYGKRPVPDDLKPITLEDAKKREELVRKARQGKVIDKEALGDEVKDKPSRRFNVVVDGEPFVVVVQEEKASIPSVTAKPAPPGPSGPARVVPASPKKLRPAPSVKGPAGKKADSALLQESAAPDEMKGTPIKAPMPGIIIRYEKAEGDKVEAGETVVVLEAMKMENSLTAPVAGIVHSVKFSPGDSVSKDEILCVIK